MINNNKIKYVVQLTTGSSAGDAHIPGSEGNFTERHRALLVVSDVFEENYIYLYRQVVYHISVLFSSFFFFFFFPFGPAFSEYFCMERYVHQNIV